MTRRYRIEHRTVYRYSDEVGTSFGRGYLHPRDLPGQRCLQHQLTVEPRPSDMAHSVDGYGNTNSYFHVTDAHTELVVVGRSDVEVSPPSVDERVAAQPWEAARPAGGADPRPSSSPSPRRWSGCRSRSGSTRDVSFVPGRPMLEAVTDLTHRIFSEFTYGTARPRCPPP